MLHHGRGQSLPRVLLSPRCPSRLLGAGCGCCRHLDGQRRCDLCRQFPAALLAPDALIAGVVGWAAVEWAEWSQAARPPHKPFPVPRQAEPASAALAVALASTQVTQIYHCGRQDPEGEPGGQSPKTATYRSLLHRNYPSTRKSVCKDSAGKCLSD